MKARRIDGHKVTIDIEKLAKVIAFNYADWPAYMGKARQAAKALPEIMKIERDLF